METLFEVVVLIDDIKEYFELTAGDRSKISRELCKQWSSKNEVPKVKLPRSEMKKRIGIKWKMQQKLPHKCDICSKAFRRMHDMKLHVQSHFGIKHHQCTMCFKKFGRNYHLRRHLNAVHKVAHSDLNEYIEVLERTEHKKRVKAKSYRCDVCSSYFSSTSHLQQHFRAKHMDRKSASPQKSTLSLDVFTNRQKKYQCAKCKSVFSKPRDLKSHMPGCNRMKSYRCEKCGKDFNRKASKINHMRLHLITAGNDITQIEYHSHGSSDDEIVEKPENQSKKSHFRCNVCKRGFKHEAAFEQHLKIHSGEKVFQCDICEKVLANKNGLYKHKLLHSKGRRYICEVCKKRFTRSDHLSKHRLCVHKISKQYVVQTKKHKVNNLNNDSEKKSVQEPNRKEKGLKCDVCDNMLSSKKCLKRHKWRVHQIKTFYTCDNCNAKFELYKEYFAHQKIHQRIAADIYLGDSSGGKKDEAAANAVEADEAANDQDKKEEISSESEKELKQKKEVTVVNSEVKTEVKEETDADKTSSPDLGKKSAEN